MVGQQCGRGGSILRAISLGGEDRTDRQTVHSRPLDRGQRGGKTRGEKWIKNRNGLWIMHRVPRRAIWTGPSFGDSPPQRSDRRLLPRISWGVISASVFDLWERLEPVAIHIYVWHPCISPWICITGLHLSPRLALQWIHDARLLFLIHSFTFSINMWLDHILCIHKYIHSCNHLKGDKIDVVDSLFVSLINKKLKFLDHFLFIWNLQLYVYL